MADHASSSLWPSVPSTVALTTLASVLLPALLVLLLFRALAPSAATLAKLGDKKKQHTQQQKKDSSRTVQRKFTAEEVKVHNTEDDCWLIIEGKVYDVTNYVIVHPGGEAILRNAGGDSTHGFNEAQHPRAAYETMAEYQIGYLDPPS